MAKVCVVLAEGFEEIEAITVVDVLRRAGVETVVLGQHAAEVRGSHGISVKTDDVLERRKDERWDLVYLPGGMPGAENLRDDPHVMALLRRQAEDNGAISAICAAPIALERAGVLEGKRVTSFPAFRTALASAREYSEERVVADENVITSRAAGTAMELALTLVTRLCGQAKSDELARAMLVR